MSWLNNFFKWLFILPIQFYKIAISPLLPSTCRYQPTCSTYMMQAIQEWGALRGTWMGLRRIGRCHPWGSSGHDPVPRKHDKK